MSAPPGLRAVSAGSIVMPRFEPQEYGEYVLHDRIGSGGMAEIFLATSRGIEGFEKRLVIKRILPTLSDDEQFVRMFIEEAKLCVSLKHPNIVQVYDLGEIDHQYFIAMEYVDGRDLLKTLAACGKKRIGFPTDIALYIVMEILRGLGHAHGLTDADGRSYGIIHRDVSPSNVLLSFEGEVKIGDFGIAKASTREKTATGILKGKFGYMAPEQVTGAVIDHRADVFAAGIVLFELLTGHRLFAGKNDLAVLERVRDAVVDPAPRHYRPDLSPELERIVLTALARRPQDRFQTAEELLDALYDYVYRSRAVVGPPHLARFMQNLFLHDEEEQARRARVRLPPVEPPSPLALSQTPRGPPPSSEEATSISVVRRAEEAAEDITAINAAPRADSSLVTAPQSIPPDEVIAATHSEPPIDGGFSPADIVERAHSRAAVDRLTPADDPVHDTYLGPPPDLTIDESDLTATGLDHAERAKLLAGVNGLAGDPAEATDVLTDSDVHEGPVDIPTAPVPDGEVQALRARLAEPEVVGGTEDLPSASPSDFDEDDGDRTAAFGSVDMVSVVSDANEREPTIDGIEAPRANDRGRSWANYIQDRPKPRREATTFGDLLEGERDHAEPLVDPDETVGMDEPEPSHATLTRAGSLGGEGASDLFGVLSVLDDEDGSLAGFGADELSGETESRGPPEEELAVEYGETRLGTLTSEAAPVYRDPRTKTPTAQVSDNQVESVARAPLYDLGKPAARDGSETFDEEPSGLLASPHLTPNPPGFALDPADDPTGEASELELEFDGSDRELESDADRGLVSGSFELEGGVAAFGAPAPAPATPSGNAVVGDHQQAHLRRVVQRSRAAREMNNARHVDSDTRRFDPTPPEAQESDTTSLPEAPPRPRAETQERTQRSPAWSKWVVALAALLPLTALALTLLRGGGTAPIPPSKQAMWASGVPKPAAVVPSKPPRSKPELERPTDDVMDDPVEAPLPEPAAATVEPPEPVAPKTRPPAPASPTKPRTAPPRRASSPKRSTPRKRAPRRVAAKAPTKGGGKLVLDCSEALDLHVRGLGRFPVAASGARSYEKLLPPGGYVVTLVRDGRILDRRAVRVLAGATVDLPCP